MSDDAATYRRIPIELFNEGNIGLIDELFADDFVEHGAPPGFLPTRDGVKAFVGALRSAFPDFAYEIISQGEGEGTHFGYIRASGTMTGDFMGMPASGKSATWDEVHIATFSDGKLAEHWSVIDRLEMMTQLGFIPPMGPPA